MSEIQDAAALAAKASKPYPNDSAEYRRVRTALLAEEIHFWGSELGGTADPGEDARGAPDPTPLWNILDLTPAGRGSDWYPKRAYGPAGASP
jgi:predicted dithiol-disulfide oxidoreductase (DUF899 family)